MNGNIERIVVDGDGYGGDGYRVIEIYYDSSRNISRVKIDSVGKTVFDSSNEICQKSPKGNITQPIKENKTGYKDILNRKCDNLKSEGKNDVEVEKFRVHYSKILEKEWKGNKFDVDTLWNIWETKIKR